MICIMFLLSNNKPSNRSYSAATKRKVIMPVIEDVNGNGPVLTWLENEIQIILFFK